MIGLLSEVSLCWLSGSMLNVSTGILEIQVYTYLGGLDEMNKPHAQQSQGMLSSPCHLTLGAEHNPPMIPLSKNPAREISSPGATILDGLFDSNDEPLRVLIRRGSRSLLTITSVSDNRKIAKELFHLIVKVVPISLTCMVY